MSKKIYTIRVNEGIPEGVKLWYTSQGGKQFEASLAVVSNRYGNAVPAFKLSVPPFYHVYPDHCTVIAEKII